MILYDLPPWIVTGYLFVFGAVIGSFLTVCVHRLPQSTSMWDGLKGLSDPPSTCPKCGRRIPLRDNIPIIGWLLLRGRCSNCKLKISPRYPLIELANGLLWVALYWMEVPEGRSSDLIDASLVTPYGPVDGEHPFLSDEWLVHLRYLYHLMLIELLLVAAWIDAGTKTIPKIVTDPFIVVGILASAIGGLYLLPLVVRPLGFAEDMAFAARALTGQSLPASLANWYAGPPSPAWRFGLFGSSLHGVAVSVCGAIAGAVPILFMRIVGRAIYDREAMGAGDVYLMALVGAFLGWQAALATIVLASLIAAVSFAAILLTSSRAEVPFGPYLAAGAIGSIFGWPWLEDRIISFSAIGPLLLPMLALLAVLFVALAWAMRVLLHPLLCRIPGYAADWYGETSAGDWTAADQNQFFTATRIDEAPLGSEAWAGDLASSGRAGESNWTD